MLSCLPRRWGSATPPGRESCPRSTFVMHREARIGWTRASKLSNRPIFRSWDVDLAQNHFCSMSVLLLPSRCRGILSAGLNFPFNGGAKVAFLGERSLLESGNSPRPSQQDALVVSRVV